MKKVTVFLLAAVLCLSFAGCRSNMEVDPMPTPPPETVPITTVPPTTIPETFDDLPNVPDPSVDDNTLQDLLPGDDMDATK